MKKLFLFLALCIISGTALHAQTIGLKAGPGMFTFVEANNQTYRLTPHFGAYYERATNAIGFRAEVLFSGQGSVNDNNSDFRTRLDYISVPLMGTYYLTDDLSIHAGGAVDFLIKEELKSPGGNVSDADAFKDFSIGFLVGVNYDFPGRFAASLRYFRGFYDIVEDDDIDDYNQGFQLSLGYRLTKLK